VIPILATGCRVARGQDTGCVWWELATKNGRTTILFPSIKEFHQFNDR
jgi:hypothetical protein